MGSVEGLVEVRDEHSCMLGNLQPKSVFIFFIFFFCIVQSITTRIQRSHLILVRMLIPFLCLYTYYLYQLIFFSAAWKMSFNMWGCNKPCVSLSSSTIDTDACRLRKGAVNQPRAAFSDVKWGATLQQQSLVPCLLLTHKCVWKKAVCCTLLHATESMIWMTQAGCVVLMQFKQCCWETKAFLIIMCSAMSSTYVAHSLKRW